MDILVIEDDPSVRALVKTVLQEKNNQVDIAESARDGERHASNNAYDLIVLDLGLPDGDGFELCKKMRENHITTPVLILSAEQETDVKIKCLRMGADDYITKPFNTEELLARIEAVTRRNNGYLEKRKLTCGELEVDMLERSLMINGNQVDLTNNEFNLLVYLLKKKDQIVTREEIAVNVWDIHFDTQTNYINVYISYLRKKIRKHTDKEYIDTVRKKGFIINCKG